MMDIKYIIASKIEAYDLFKRLLTAEFGLSDGIADSIIRDVNDGLLRHTDPLIDTCYFFAETKYVDKVYRDSYYNYFSTKLGNYNKFCARISIFDGEIKMDDFASEVNIEKVKLRFLGYITLRPTYPNIIGRSIISPKALKSNNFYCCSARFNTSCNSIKLVVEGFPHSSQDTETISCAETTIWSVMEYFSARYPDYRPVLPSTIINTLNRISVERQIPSRGLNIQQISFALKEFGFGSRIYSRQEYGEDFENLLSCYIESGIPLIVAIENRPEGDIGHALLCIGHEKIKDPEFDTCSPLQINDPHLRNSFQDRNITLYDFNSIKKNFVFIDDNHPSYQLALLENPAGHYNNPDWHSCKITYFVVPLYPKIYLEAFEARRFVINYLANPFVYSQKHSEILIRFFLASTRSLKDRTAVNPTMQPDMRNTILSTVMPKFVWVAELSTKDLIKKGMASGIIIIDATEANTSWFKPLILAFHQNNYVYLDNNGTLLINKLFSLQNFNIFENNLQIA